MKRSILLTGAALLVGTWWKLDTLDAGFVRDEVVVGLAMSLIPIAGFFQVFDGLQVVSAGVLRGVADTRFPMIIGLVGFWVVGLPISLLLAFRVGLGPVGLWWGLVAGLGSVSLLLLARVRNRLRRETARVRVDDALPV